MVYRTRIGTWAAGVATAGLLLASLAPSMALAAVPDATATSRATPGAVSPGEIAGYVVTFTNEDTSNIAQVRLTASMSDGFAYTVDSAVTTLGSCATGAGPLNCTIGSVRPGVTVTIVVGLTTNPDGSSVGTRFSFRSSGATSNDGGTSHGDTWDTVATTQLNGDPDFKGRFVSAAAQQTVENLQALSVANPHATRVIAPAKLIPVTVQDGRSTAIVCGTAAFDLCPATAFGETSEINVNDGSPYASPFQVVISFDSSELPSGVNQANIKIYHQWSDAYGTDDELIAGRCTFAKGASTPSSVPCVTVRKLPGNDLQVTVWTTKNGSMKGYN